MTLRELTDYYAALLVYQYRGLPNATRQMQLYTKQALADFLAQSVREAFNLDTAVGAQLDVLGKYLGASRQVWPGLTKPYFGFWTYASTHDPADYQGTWLPETDVPALPDASSATGKWYAIQVSATSTTPIVATFEPGDLIYSDGTTWVREPFTTDNGNGLTSYSDIATNTLSIFLTYNDSDLSNTDLTDVQYRAALKLQAINSTGDTTLAGIMSALNTSFGTQLKLTDNTDMTMTYDVASTFPLTPNVLRKFLPRPMAVGINIHVVTPPAEGCEIECRTKTAEALVVGFDGPTGVKYRNRTVSGSLTMRKLFSGTTCTPTYPGGGLQSMTAIPVFYYTNQYYDATVTITLDQVDSGLAYYTLTGVTVVPAAGYPVYPVPAYYPMVNSSIRSVGYTWTETVGTVFTAGVAITAIYGYGIGAVNYQAGVYEYTDTWDIQEEVLDDGSIDITSNTTTRVQNGDSMTPIPGHQGQVPPGGTAYVAAGRPDLFYVPWSTLLVQMEPTYTSVSTAADNRMTTGLGCVVGTGYGPTRMYANGTVTELFTTEETDTMAMDYAMSLVPWAPGCETASFIETHAAGTSFDFVSGEFRVTIGTLSPLIVGQSYEITIVFVRRAHGTSDPFLPLSTMTVDIVAPSTSYTTDWIEVPNSEGYDTKVGECSFTTRDGLAYALTSGGDLLSTSTGDKLVFYT